MTSINVACHVILNFLRDITTVTIFQLPAVIYTRVLTGLQASMTSTDLGVKISLLLALMWNVMLSSGLLEITTIFQLSKVRHTRVLTLLPACMTSTDVENHVMLHFLRNYNCFPGIRSYTYPFSSTLTS